MLNQRGQVTFLSYKSSTFSTIPYWDIIIHSALNFDYKGKLCVTHTLGYSKDLIPCPLGTYNSVEIKDHKC